MLDDMGVWADMAEDAGQSTALVRAFRAVLMLRPRVVLDVSPFRPGPVTGCGISGDVKGDGYRGRADGYGYGINGNGRGFHGDGLGVGGNATADW